MNSLKWIFWYFENWNTLIFKPIFFYVKRMSGKWSDDALTFLLFSSWIFSFVLTLVIFIAVYWPIGVTLVVKVSGLRMLLISPMILAIALDFFIMTLFLVGGILMILFFMLFFAMGACLHFIYNFILKEKGSLLEMVKVVFYSSGVLLFFILPLKT